jgi:chromosome segregation ATPase
MINPRTAALVLALVPATLVAQRGGGGRGGGSRMGRGDEGGGSASSMLRLSNGDVEEMSPIKRLIDKKKDLKLTDAQVKQFKDLESEMKQRNEHLFKQLDSLRKDMTPSGSGAFERIANDRQAVEDVVGNIRLSYNETLKRATEQLDDPQKQKAAELIQQLNDDADKTLKDKLEGRAGRGDDGGRRGRPPLSAF